MSFSIEDFKSKLLGNVHYSGVCGDFWYDPDMFEINGRGSDEYLHFKGSVSSIEIPHGVTKLYRTFEKENELHSVSLPDTLKEIGSFSFFMCKYLDSIEIPGSVEVIGEEAFFGCEVLKNVKLSEGLIEIGKCAFSGCDSMEYVYIPDSVKSIGSECFYFTRLKEMSLPTTLDKFNVQDIPGMFTSSVIMSKVKIRAKGHISLDHIEGSLSNLCWYSGEYGEFLYSRDDFEYRQENGQEFFRYVGKDTFVTINTKFRKMTRMFEGRIDITEVLIPGSVVELGESCFEGCSSLRDVYTESSHFTLGKKCFKGCTSLTHIDIPDGIKELEEQCFADCKSLMIDHVNVPVLGAECFKGCENLFMSTFLHNTISIGDDCFAGCIGLTCLTFPETLQSIGKDIFKDCNDLFGIYAYDDKICEQLKHEGILTFQMHKEGEH